jgi:hypothetical protein
MNTKYGLIVLMVGCMIGSAVGGYITPSSMLTHISVRGTNDVVDFYSPTLGLPSAGTLNASEQNVTAEADYSFSDAGFIISNVDYSLGAANDKSTFAEVYGIIIFTPTVDTDWELSGAYSWAGDWANGFSLFARIQDTATQTEVTRHYYDSAGVLSNVNYIVGTGVGNVSNIVGPTSGTLLAGVEYEYQFGLAVDNNQYSPQTGSAVGELALDFIVPEPATMLLLGLGGLVLRKRK